MNAVPTPQMLNSMQQSGFVVPPTPAVVTQTPYTFLQNQSQVQPNQQNATTLSAFQIPPNVQMGGTPNILQDQQYQTYMMQMMNQNQIDAQNQQFVKQYQQQNRLNTSVDQQIPQFQQPAVQNQVQQPPIVQPNAHMIPQNFGQQNVQQPMQFSP
jgi:hypothetical protein